MPTLPLEVATVPVPARTSAASVAASEGLSGLARLPRFPLALGLAGSCAMAASGSGMTFVFGTATPMPWFFTLPASWSAHHLGLLEVCFYLGLAALTGAWLLLGGAIRRGQGPGVHGLWVAAGLWSVPLIVGPPFLSTDLWSYLGLAAVVHAGFDPYRFGPAVLGNVPVVSLTAPIWRALPSAYGPLFLALATVIARGAGPHLALGVLGLRVLAVVALVVVARFVPRLARALGADPVWATWLAVASPLILCEFVSSGHNDIVMIALVLVGLTLREEGRPVAAIAMCALGVMVKAPAVIPLGLVALAWIGAARGWRERARRTCQAGVVAGGVMIATSLAAGLGWGWISTSALSTPSHLLSDTTPTDVIGALAGGVARALGVHISLVHAVRLAGLVGLAVAGAFCLGVLRRGARLGWARCAGLCLLVVAVLSPIVSPWYLGWGFIILACTRPTQSSAVLVALAALTEFVFGPVSMPDVLPFILTMGLASCVAASYGLRWSLSHLVRRAPPSWVQGESGRIDRKPAIQV